eukprot:Sdes_comp20000_c0_seq4m12640
MYVLHSITPNARGIFRILCRYQLDQQKKLAQNQKESIADSSDFKGFSYRQYYLKCRENFLVNSEMTMRSQLTEFKDHKIIHSIKASDGVEYLHIPFPDIILTQALEQMDELGL